MNALQNIKLLLNCKGRAPSRAQAGNDLVAFAAGEAFPPRYSPFWRRCRLALAEVLLFLGLHRLAARWCEPRPDEPFSAEHSHLVDRIQDLEDRRG